LAASRIARGENRIHSISFNPSALREPDYLICYQCGFILRLFAVPAAERVDLAKGDKSCGNALTRAFGAKFYPMESITEQLNTRIGQAFGLNIAESKLRMIDGQVRFMSKYFLDRQNEQLTHGAEIFELSLGKENYQELADKKSEKDYFTFQMTAEAVKVAFPDHHENIMAGFVEMLAFDALIGHNDRHPYNWGVIVPIRKNKPPRFSPVFDTARALFWNNPERRIIQMLNSDAQLDAYIDGCAPPIGWDGEEGVAFFGLMSLISTLSSRYGRLVQKFLDAAALNDGFGILEKEFKLLMSPERRELIRRCLKRRQQMLKEACRM
jgi:hypothetical protein